MVGDAASCRLVPPRGSCCAGIRTPAWAPLGFYHAAGPGSSHRLDQGPRLVHAGIVYGGTGGAAEGAAVIRELPNGRLWPRKGLRRGRRTPMMNRLNFRVEARATGSRARAATFRTLHNEVRTPLFMPVGTQATVKAQLPQTLEDSGSQILLANTYHLLLRPGAEVFRRLGGIHDFMSWKRSVLTDSGGFQIFSLPHSRSMTEAGAVFQSYTDGRTILLSPEVSIETQRAIGSDIMMALDQCVPSTADEATARAALGITHRWAARSLAARGEDSPQALFAIIQGALFRELRRESALRLGEMPFDGLAIGGLAVGESQSRARGYVRVHGGPDAGGPAALPHGRGHAAGYPGRRCIAAWICSIASSPRRWRSAAGCLLRGVTCNCGGAFTNSPRNSWIRRAIARRAPGIRAPICTTSRRRGRRWGGSCWASITCISTTGSCGRCARASWRTGSWSFTGKSARCCTRTIWTTRSSIPGRSR